jgi:hypothetical protein
LRLNTTVSGTESARFSYPGSQSIDHGGYWGMHNTANQKYHERRFTRRVDAGRNPYSLHPGLLHESRGMRRMNHGRALHLRRREGIYQLGRRHSLFIGDSIYGRDRSTAREQIAFYNSRADAVDLRRNAGARLSSGHKKYDCGLRRIIEARANAHSLHFGMRQQCGSLCVSRS